ncbi:Sas10 C-terminal domain-containing protein [Gloeopeniophorella convolvens]|nr:Sas10 C-terminal domain-containing protein [Gloeopeniophorella convolvens]
MVRRRSTKVKNSRGGPRPVDKKDARMRRWNTAEDIPMDEEDQFHASKDRILLEGEEVGDDEDGDEEEVFALRGVPASDSEEEGEYAYEDEDEAMSDKDGEEEPQPKARASKKGKAKAKPPSESDDEDEESEEEEESWGRNKSAYYSSNAAELESDDEEANEMEEQEAKRLQMKARDVMVDDDFGLADIADEDAEDAEDPLLEPAPAVTTQPALLDPKAAIKHMEKTTPETLALAYDWEDIATKVVRTQERIKTLTASGPDSQLLGMVHLHNQALLTYATTLAFYLYLRSSEYYSQRPELLRTHPVFARLLQLKQALSTLEDLDFDISESDPELEDSEEDDESLGDEEDLDLEDSSILRKRHRKSSQLAFDDLAELLREAEEAATGATSKRKQEKQATAPVPPVKEPPKKKRKTSSTAKPAPVFDLEEPTYVPSKPRAVGSSTAPATEQDAFGDATALGAADAADKRARRHTLRFHTASIERASARRQGARAALGGDDDVPYRQRRKEKEARAAREAQAGQRGLGGADLDDAEPEARGGSDGEEGADGYYSLVQRKKRAEKEGKKAAYEAAKAASRADLDADADDAAGGPRSLTRAILKNRGLTPHRSKSVRNPRVKKRQKFDKAQKKLKSQKAVFTAGAGDATRYGGERSGISTVVKSVRF